MMKTTVLFFALFVVTVGCSTQNESPSTAPAVAAQERLKVSSADEEKLAKADCKIQEGLVFYCKSPEANTFGNDLLASLTFQKERLTLQLETMQEVQQSIKTRIKSEKLSELQKSDAENFLTLFSSNIANVTVQITNKNWEIAEEGRYQYIIGTRCSGSYTAGNAVQKIEELTSRPGYANQDVSKTYSSADGSGFTAELNSYSGSRFVWRSSNLINSETSPKANIFVDTDAEFALKISDTADTNLTCYRFRESTWDSRISERPVEKRSITCKTKIVGTAIFNDYNLSFQVTKIDEKHSLELTQPKDNHMSDQEKKLLANLKYGARLVSDKGFLMFQAYEVATQKPIVDLQFINSAPSIAFGLDDQAGNTLTVKCSDEVAIGQRK